MRDRDLSFATDPGLRRGDSTPSVLWDDTGQRVLGKHWPIVRSVAYTFGGTGPIRWSVTVGKPPTESCDSCALNMRCLKSQRDVTLCLLSRELDTECAALAGRSI